MSICAFNARTLASECIEDLMMQARKIKYDVIGLTETRRHRPLHAVFGTGEELFLGTCESRGVGGVGVLVNTHLAMNMDSYESLTTRIGRLRLRRCGSTPVLTLFGVYAPTPSYDEEELEAFYVDLEKLYKEDHTFFKIIVGDFNAKIGPRRTAEDLYIGTHGMEWNEQGERLFEFIMSTHTIHVARSSRSPLIPDMGVPGGQFHNEIDHIVANQKFCLTDVAVVPKFYTGSDRRLFRARFRFQCVERELRSSGNEVPRLWSIGITSLHWRLCGKIPSATTSMKNMTGMSNIFTMRQES
nr:Endonuclease exonuclease phosphatase domain containing protein [Haemonchus contortus]